MLRPRPPCLTPLGRSGPAGLVLLGLIAAGCGTGGTGVAARPLPAATVASAAPAAGASADDGPAHRSERARVLAAARRYFAASNALARHTDPARLAAVLAPGCTCRAQVRAARRAQRHGQTITGQARVRSLRATVLSTHEATVLADYDFSGGGLVSPTGVLLVRNPARHAIHWQFVLRRRAGRWQITRIDAIR